MLTLGDVRVHLVPAGAFALDGGAMFGVVPREVWERTDPPDERNRVSLACHVALVEAAGRRVLVETGMGDRWSDKEIARYRIDLSADLAGGLAALGVGPDQIDMVVNTHLHFDHAGGNTRWQDRRLVPTFPRARYVVQRGEWEDAMRPHERNRASYRAEDFVPVAEAGLLEPVAGEAEVVPGVRVVPVGGHTAHHQIVIVEGGGRTLVVPTDLVPTTSHLPLPFVMGYDLFPVGTLEAKRTLLARVVAEGWWMLFYHDPRVRVGTVKLDGGRYTLADAVV